MSLPDKVPLPMEESEVIILVLNKQYDKVTVEQLRDVLKKMGLQIPAGANKKMLIVMLLRAVEASGTFFLPPEVLENAKDVPETLPRASRGSSGAGAASPKRNFASPKRNSASPKRNSASPKRNSGSKEVVTVDKNNGYGWKKISTIFTIMVGALVAGYFNKNYINEKVNLYKGFSSSPAAREEIENYSEDNFDRFETPEIYSEDYMDSLVEYNYGF